MITFPASLSSGVIPKLSPAVAYAEKHSNAISSRLLSLSVIVKANIDAPIANSDSIMIANALLTASFEIRRLKISKSSFPRARLMILRNATAKVVVLIPPPVDPGEAPIHISNMINITVGNVKLSILATLNPAVREDVPVKNAVTHFPQSVGCSANIWLYSNAKVDIVPTTIKMNVVQAMSRELKLITHAR